MAAGNNYNDECRRQNNFCTLCKLSWWNRSCELSWDTWSRLHPDDNWWQNISHQFADTAQAIALQITMRDYNDGITNGYAWYRVAGGRQGLYDLFRRGREVTIEISDVKLIRRFITSRTLVIT